MARIKRMTNKEAADAFDALADKLTEIALVDANPDNWAGANVPRKEWDAAIRGDRVWDAKAAGGVLKVLTQVHNLAEHRRKAAAGAKPGADLPSEDVADRVARAAARAQAAVEKAVGRTH